MIPHHLATGLSCVEQIGSCVIPVNKTFYQVYCLPD
jgi:hypothetical protein